MGAIGMKALFSVVLLVPALLDAQSVPAIDSVVNGGAFDNRLAPGALADIFGSHFGTDTSIAVTVGDKPAKVTLANPDQLVIQIPVDAPVGPSAIRVATSTPFPITLNQYAPGLISRGSA